MSDIARLLPALRRLHDLMREQVFAAIASRPAEDLAEIVGYEGGDVVFALDRVSEEVLVDFVTREIASQQPIVLIAEGLPSGQLVLPEGASEEQCRERIIVDPIDGSRPLLFQKRSAWILTGVAPNRGPETSLRDIELAVQTEIPLLKQHLSDQLWALRGGGAAAHRYNRITGEAAPVALGPTSAESVQYGFASISRFFPGQRDVLAAIDDDVIRAALGPLPPGSPSTYEDQNPSTGGQLYGLMSGADRFLADLRPLMQKIADQRNQTLGHCCHPYDICTLLIAEEMGVRITDVRGAPLDARLDVEIPIAWAGYANAAIRRQIEPVLQQVLAQRDLSC